MALTSLQSRVLTASILAPVAILAVLALPPSGFALALGLILLGYLAVTLAYGALNPLFEAPDEHWHFFTAAHIADNGKGGQGGAALLTTTVRHDASQELSAVWHGVSSAWYAVTSTGAWKRERERYGIRGYIRATEVTHGKSGWHVHCHTIILFEDAEPHPVLLQDLADGIHRRWSRGAQRAGLKAPSRKHGTDIRRMDATDTKTLADYLSKLGENADADLRREWDRVRDEAAGDLAAEATLGALKEAKDGNRTPHAILGSLLGRLEKAAGKPLGAAAADVEQHALSELLHDPGVALERQRSSGDADLAHR